jgi:hypothetical protein
MQSARHSLHIALTPGHLEGYLHVGMPEIHNDVFLVLFVLVLYVSRGEGSLPICFNSWPCRTCTSNLGVFGLFRRPHDQISFSRVLGKRRSQFGHKRSMSHKLIERLFFILLRYSLIRLSLFIHDVDLVPITQHVQDPTNYFFTRARIIIVSSSK